jgi:FtsP/CotA-like multicopper oxidase with cupredoxin domain
MTITPDDFRKLRFKDALRFPTVVKLDGLAERLTVTAVAHETALHSALPLTPMWAYKTKIGKKSVINPTLETRSHKVHEIVWRNGIGSTARLPIKAVTVAVGEGAAPEHNKPGSASTYPSQPGALAANNSFVGLDQLPPWVVTHLHGGVTEPDSDGWTENALLSGQSHVSRYHNRQPSTLLWYHDHAAHVTRLNVYAGLAGLYMIRDDDDDQVLNCLKLGGSMPDDRPEFELPLLIQDCNLELDAGKLTGQLVHKVESPNGAMEFFGPFTMVNKQIWPKCAVQPRQYRLRLLNGANARTFALSLMDGAGALVPLTSIAHIIGTDGGLLRTAIACPDTIVLAPAERVDVIIDFSAFAGQSLTLVNRAKAPFAGQVFAAPVIGPDTAPADADIEYLGGRVPYPEIMRFVIGQASGAKPPVINVKTMKLSSTFMRITHADVAKPGEIALPHGHVHRTIALVEEAVRPDVAGQAFAKMLTLRELSNAMPTPPLNPDLRLIQFTGTAPGWDTGYYETKARFFHDGVTIMSELGTFEVWKIVNLSPDTHPFHIHLTPVQVLKRQLVTMTPPADTVDWRDLTQGPVTVAFGGSAAADPTDVGWKDVVRVGSGEIVYLAVPFGEIVNGQLTPQGFTGRYMYHCHILEHEDHDMMRPFVVVPGGIIKLMHGGGHGGHGGHA